MKDLWLVCRRATPWLCVQLLRSLTTKPTSMSFTLLLMLYRGPQCKQIQWINLRTYCYAPKRPSPFFLYIHPRKNPLSMIKYELSTSCRWCFLTWVQLHQQTGKNWPIHEPLFTPPRKIPFINAIQPFYGCQRNARKNITVTVSVRAGGKMRICGCADIVTGNLRIQNCGYYIDRKFCKFSVRFSSDVPKSDRILSFS